MAKSKRDDDLFKKLRASGLRKRAARAIAEAGDNSAKLVRGAAEDLRGLADQLDSKREATKRSNAAKKAAATRARKRSSSSRSRSRS